jgi:hypothetical protein
MNIPIPDQQTQLLRSNLRLHAVKTLSMGSQGKQGRPSWQKAKKETDKGQRTTSRLELLKGEA